MREEGPHRGGRVDLGSRPGVTEAVDANQPHLRPAGASGVADDGEWAGRILLDRWRAAGVVACPSGERLFDAFDPLRPSPVGVPRIRVLRIGESVQGQYWHRPPLAWPRPP